MVSFRLVIDFICYLFLAFKFQINKKTVGYSDQNNCFNFVCAVLITKRKKPLLKSCFTETISYNINSYITAVISNSRLTKHHNLIRDFSIHA